MEEPPPGLSKLEELKWKKAQRAKTGVGGSEGGGTKAKVKATAKASSSNDGSGTAPAARPPMQPRGAKAARLAQLKDELSGLKVRALQQKAAAAGITEQDIDDADDTAGLIELILAATAAKEDASGAASMAPPQAEAAGHAVMHAAGTAPQERPTAEEEVPLIETSSEGTPKSGGSIISRWGDCDWAQGDEWDGVVPISVASTPEITFPEERKAMEVIMALQHKIKSGKFVAGFDFAGSANATKELKDADADVWKKLEAPIGLYYKAEGAEKEAIFKEQIEPAIKETVWWDKFTNQVVGNAKGHCQHDRERKCIIFCVHGGAISNVEQRNMADILRSVDLKGTPRPQFAIKNGTLEELEKVRYYSLVQLYVFFCRFLPASACVGVCVCVCVYARACFILSELRGHRGFCELC
jgi:hypothetical protein